MIHSVGSLASSQSVKKSYHKGHQLNEYILINQQKGCHQIDLAITESSITFSKNTK